MSDLPNLHYGKVINGEFVPDNKKHFREFMLANEGKSLYTQFKRETGIRSDTQNDALHLYFELLAREFNEAGLSVKKVLEHKIELSWTKESIKELLWKPAQKALKAKKSTTELNKVDDIQDIYEHLNRHISEKFGIYVPFPSKENVNLQ